MRRYPPSSVLMAARAAAARVVAPPETPAIDALRRASVPHTVTEPDPRDLGPDRSGIRWNPPRTSRR